MHCARVNLAELCKPWRKTSRFHLVFLSMKLFSAWLAVVHRSPQSIHQIFQVNFLERIKFYFNKQGTCWSDRNSLSGLWVLWLAESDAIPLHALNTRGLLKTSTGATRVSEGGHEDVFTRSALLCKVIAQAWHVVSLEYLNNACQAVNPPAACEVCPGTRESIRPVNNISAPDIIKQTYCSFIAFCGRRTAQARGSWVSANSTLWHRWCQKALIPRVPRRVSKHHTAHWPWVIS